MMNFLRIQKNIVCATCLLIMFIFFSPMIGSALPLEKVSLQLEWKYQFEYAGFIMAREKGFYSDVGLDVELREYETGDDPVENVLSQKANYGIHNSSVVINNGKLEPIILLATYFQQSPLVIVASKEIDSPNDLIGKTIMGTSNELKYSSLALMLNHFFVNRKNTVFKDHTFDMNDFIQHKVDAVTVFRTNQLYELNRQHIEYNIIDPADYGFVMSAVNVFTSYSEALNHPDRTQKFIDASNRGWNYALSHPDETISVIFDKYSKRKSLEALQFEAKVTREMMLLDFFEIGATNKDLSLRAVDQLQYSGLLQQDQELGDFMFEEALRKFGLGVKFTDKQKLYLQEKKEITMCVDPDWMPFESIHDGKHIGIAADVFATFEKHLPVPVRLVETQSWQESIAKAEKRECDIFSLASSTPEREKFMDFTSAYIDLPIVMATKTDTFFISNIDEVKDKKLGIVKGYAIAETLRAKFDSINIIDVDSISDGLRRVESGELFGYIDNLMVIANSIQKDFTGVLKVSSRLDEGVKLAIGTRSDQPQLRDVFEVLVSNISEVELQAIFNKWVSIKQEVAFDYSLLWKILAVLFVLTVAFFYHYSKLRMLNSELETLSVTDKLTGLYNRVKTDEMLLLNKASLDRYGVESSIILMDIDLFKTINDTYGHMVGDSVLVELAHVIKQNVRITDCVGRWGGEEFLIVCPNTGITAAKSLADKVLQKVRNHSFPIVGKITLSAGVGAFSKEESLQSTLRNVDKSLYNSKENGRDQLQSVE
ncbi:diguanylate cyclase [Mariprofundus sp. NF]|uniref:diguanylate cyclase n=1 Tax=Mariprofundus sp. NF TaxID=2608716 RepID=UPI001F50D44B|nr:diguanylate cyclase [Mariprofundus sp. NF]